MRKRKASHIIIHSKFPASDIFDSFLLVAYQFEVMIAADAL